MGKKKAKKISNNSFFEDEKRIGAGNVSVIPKGKAKKVESKEGISPNLKILILCEGQTEVNYFKGITRSKTYKYKMGVVHTATVSMPIVKEENTDKKYQFNQVQNLFWFAINVIKKTTKETKKNKDFLASIDAHLDLLSIEEEDYLNRLKNFYASTSNDDKQKINQLKQKIGKEENELKESRLYKKKYLNLLLQHTYTNSDNPFDQIWLICDNDDNKSEKHNLFTTLFAKAKEFGIHIAYSNRQFENWILLHFEKTLHTSNESSCKRGCSSDLCHLENDQTKNCLIGYLKGKKYHINYKKGDWRRESNEEISVEKEEETLTKEYGKRTDEYCYEGLFDASVQFHNSKGELCDIKKDQEKVVFEKIRTAIQNAEWLRNQQGNPKPEIATNPYTNVDKLVEILIET